MGNKNNLKEQCVSNNQFWRGISDKLDRFMRWQGNKKNQSIIRRVLHGSHHFFMGIGKKLIGNQKGAQAQLKRAKDQFNLKLKIHHFGDKNSKKI